MFKIIHKQILAQDIKRLDISVPLIAAKVQPGQFVMVTPLARARSIPMTVVDSDERKGSISLIVHEVGDVTRQLGQMSIGDLVHNIVGPLGGPAMIDQYGVVICVATGIGAAQILPICRALKKKGNKIIGIVGAKSKNVLMLESQMRVVCDEMFITTNDGSYERKGLASQVLKELLNKFQVKAVYAIGSVEMMRSAVQMAREKEIPVRVTLNPYMSNGLGLCGSCRVRVGGGFKLACVDGPEFNGYDVDFTDYDRRIQAVEGIWEQTNQPISRPKQGFTTLVKSLWGSVKK